MSEEINCSKAYLLVPPKEKFVLSAFRGYTDSSGLRLRTRVNEIYEI
jgi:hypothetical protein